jgi:uncharacterized protein
MIRLLWWLVLGLIGWAAWRNWRQGSRDIEVSRRSPSVPPARQVPDRLMVACARCGVHLPRDEAVADAGGQLYCSALHRDAGPQLPQS